MSGGIYSLCLYTKCSIKSPCIYIERRASCFNSLAFQRFYGEQNQPTLLQHDKDLTVMDSALIQSVLHVTVVMRVLLGLMKNKSNEQFKLFIKDAAFD